MLGCQIHRKLTLTIPDRGSKAEQTVQEMPSTVNHGGPHIIPLQRAKPCKTTPEVLQGKPQQAEAKAEIERLRKEESHGSREASAASRVCAPVVVGKGLGFLGHREFEKEKSPTHSCGSLSALKTCMYLKASTTKPKPYKPLNPKQSYTVIKVR